MTLTTWIAEFDGPCGLCEKGIVEGDRCVFVDDEPVHAQCAVDDGHEVEDL